MGSKTTWALCCSMLSLAGFLFLFVVGVLVQVQPEYMKLGKNVRSSTPLFETAFLYGTLFVVSTIVYYLENKKENPGNAHRYHLIPTAAEERKPLLENEYED
uniref:Uncharacterized protein n=1 Tax=Globisporangium ultimum (strain ATCC 200006 / CBS 805.95 / DAOM BR144) TaxID=431595 RepID=K3WSA0_GLOUD